MSTVKTLVVPHVIIGKKEMDEYLATPHNPPSRQLDRVAYIKEWYGAMSHLKHSLAARWRHGIGDGDFYVDGECEPDRMLCVEVTQRAIICPDLLSIVHSAVVRLEQDYAVDVCNSWFCLKGEHGVTFPAFNVVVERQRVLAYSEVETTLHLMGLT